MKRLAVAFALLATPAFAQQTPPTPGQRACQIQFERMTAQDQQDAGAAIQMQDEIGKLQKQVADLTKDRDALKAKVPVAKAPDVAAKPAK